jgi:hypothetical protein
MAASMAAAAGFAKVASLGVNILIPLIIGTALFEKPLD